MSQETNQLTWMQCCNAVMEAAKDSKSYVMQIAAGYASVGRRMSTSEIPTQALYMLTNLDGWRGDEAHRVKARLKEFANADG